MTLNEISYMILELIRQGHIVDDEDLDLRIIYKFLETKRVEFIRSQIERRYRMSPNCTQELTLDVTPVVINSERYLIAENVPSFLNTRFGLAIETISTDTYKNIMFKHVSSVELPYVGNGRFNKGIVYGAYDHGKMVFKSKNFESLLINRISVVGVLNDPTQHPDFDPDVTEYPIDSDGIEYIKKEALSSDIRIFLNGIPDTFNDASGDIKNQ